MAFGRTAVEMGDPPCGDRGEQSVHGRTDRHPGIGIFTADEPSYGGAKSIVPLGTERVEHLIMAVQRSIPEIATPGRGGGRVAEPTETSPEQVRGRTHLRRQSGGRRLGREPPRIHRHGMRVLPDHVRAHLRENLCPETDVSDIGYPIKCTGSGGEDRCEQKRECSVLRPRDPHFSRERHAAPNTVFRHKLLPSFVWGHPSPP